MIFDTCKKCTICFDLSESIELYWNIERFYQLMSSFNVFIHTFLMQYDETNESNISETYFKRSFIHWKLNFRIFAFAHSTDHQQFQKWLKISNDMRSDIMFKWRKIIATIQFSQYEKSIWLLDGVTEASQMERVKSVLEGHTLHEVVSYEFF